MTSVIALLATRSRTSSSVDMSAPLRLGRRSAFCQLWAQLPGDDRQLRLVVVDRGEEISVDPLEAFGLGPNAFRNLIGAADEVRGTGLLVGAGKEPKEGPSLPPP